MACKQPKQPDTSIANKLNAEAAYCQQFYDSMVALADTPVAQDEIEVYKHLYTQKEINNEKYHFTYTQLIFNTGDAKWDKQLNELFAKKIKDELSNWINDCYETRLDTGEEGLWNKMTQSVEIIPLFVSNQWLTVEYKTEGNYGGAHALWEVYYYHYYKDPNGRLNRLKQPDIFIYDKDTSVRHRYYNTILKGMDNEMNTDTAYTLPGCELSIHLSSQEHTINLSYFTEAEYYYLIPTKTGLKTKNYYSDVSTISDRLGYQPNIIIPYKSLKGIVQEKYLSIWMNQ